MAKGVGGAERLEVAHWSVRVVADACGGRTLFAGREDRIDPDRAGQRGAGGQHHQPSHEGLCPDAHRFNLHYHIIVV